MYIIEMHYLNRAFAQVILEKQDGAKTYEEFSNYRLITNHANNLTVNDCRWCAFRRRAAGAELLLVRERSKQ